jgi:hypothetical protein
MQVVMGQCSISQSGSCPSHHILMTFSVTKGHSNRISRELNIVQIEIRGNGDQPQLS